MTEIADAATMVQKYVLVFDFCSSTSILEDLIRSENQQRWRNLLIEVKKFLMLERRVREFEIYKFVGDGWILLFDSDFLFSDLLSFMKRLSDKYDDLLSTMVSPVLAKHIDPLGITFGLEKGSLIHFEMDRGEYEYIGRAINVASRLQAAIKTEDDNPKGKVLTSKHVYDKEKERICKEYRTRPVVVELKNISGGEGYQGILLSLTDKPHKDPVRWRNAELKLERRDLCLPTDPLLNCTFEVEFRIDDDGGDESNWFGVRLRGRGEAKSIFDGYLIYVRSCGRLDVKTVGGQSILEIEKQVASPTSDFVTMKISIIEDQISLLIGGEPMHFAANGAMRSGKVYLHAFKSKVTIRSACLSEVIV